MSYADRPQCHQPMTDAHKAAMRAGRERRYARQAEAARDAQERLQRPVAAKLPVAKWPEMTPDRARAILRGGD